ncbi:MAG TPA: PQQ-binding-like beta-propeller repeat protein [Streptosporangiaceae bacterium]|nr:PQQ-binding-like beta-propeller repeat protein [Streptosporangiaceae bacterium]
MLKWHDTPGVSYQASPTVADGSVFIGSDAGWFYQLNPTTGAIVHKRFLGQLPTGTCYGPEGVTATATVAANPQTHRLTVYVGGPKGYLYAFSASNLKLEWKAVIGIPSGTNYYDWSSPTVANGKVYIGVSSDCEQPAVRGAVIAYSQVTGKKIAAFYTEPKGVLGGGIWSSVAVGGNGDVYASVGGGPFTAPKTDYSDSIIKLAPGTLKLLASWQVPASGIDFGGSPVLFGSYVGACNKDGVFYALKQKSMTLAWKRRIGAVYDPSEAEAECNGAPAYNGKDLFFAAGAVSIKGTSYRGSVQERIPSSGKLVWETGLPEGVTGSPTLDGAGVLTIGTYDNGPSANETYLVNADTGQMIDPLVSGLDFAQSVFADGWLFTANSDGVYAWAPRPPH